VKPWQAKNSVMSWTNYFNIFSINVFASM